MEFFLWPGCWRFMYVFDCSLQRNAKLQDADANAWWDTMCQLQKILRRAAQVLHAAKKLDDEGVHNYYMSGRTPVGLPTLQDENIHGI